MTRPSGSATAPASTATGSPRCARCSRAAALDVLTGDYLAELTMLILGKDTMKDPSLGYARTFVRQVEDCLGLALEKGVRIVSNAGGLNPAGLADRLREVAKGLGLDPAIAHVEGDDLRAASGSVEGALTANAYLGGFGIAAALTRRRRRRRHRPGHRRLARGRAGGRPLRLDADVVRRAGRRRRRRPRPRVRHPGHRRQLLRLPHARRTTARRSGFPLAEIAADGSQRDHQARRHRRRGHRRHRHRAAGLRDPVDPLPQPRRHHAPRLDPARARTGADRVAVTGVRGEAPPERLKVCVNELGGFRNTVEFVLTGLDIEAKADWVRAQLEPRADARSDGRLVPDRASPPPDADTEEGASCLLRCTVMDPQADPVGKAFTAPGGRARARRRTPASR